MNPRERVLTAANHRIPDRVPITFDAQPEVYEMLYRHFGIDSRKELWDALHVDTWLGGSRKLQIPGTRNWATACTRTAGAIVQSFSPMSWPATPRITRK